VLPNGWRISRRVKQRAHQSETRHITKASNNGILDQAVGCALVSGAVTRPTATTEPRVMVSRSRGSSVYGALSLVPFAVYLIVTVCVE